MHNINGSLSFLIYLTSGGPGIGAANRPDLVSRCKMPKRYSGLVTIEPKAIHSELLYFGLVPISCLVCLKIYSGRLFLYCAMNRIWSSLHRVLQHSLVNTLLIFCVNVYTCSYQKSLSVAPPISTRKTLEEDPIFFFQKHVRCMHLVATVAASLPWVP